MSHRLSPSVVAVTLALACSSVLAAKAAKPAAKAAPAPVAAADFELAHNLSPAGEEQLQAVVERFNKENGGNLKLSRLEKGEKPAGLNLIRRYDMSDVLAQPKAFVPLHEMMTKAGQPLKVGELTADLKAGAVDGKGRLVALPLIYSTPVLFYNKNAFRKAGLNPDQPPKTWFEMQGVLDKLQDAGYACPYTSSWPVWVHIDNVSAVSGVPAVSDKGTLAFNGLPQVKHIAMMATWTKANYFKLFGRRNEASAKFNDGECAMITTDSREHIDFRAAKGVELGVAPLPYHDDVYGGRQNSLADGASLWVGAGKSAAEYKQAAKFVSFLLSPEMQIEMVRVYGGLPLTAAARAAARSKLLQDGDQTLEIAYASMKGKGASHVPHVADADPVRILTNEELEAVWADKKPAKAALDTAVSRGNAILGAKPALKKAQPF
ncbi:extracellular solute-binding protein [Ferribacterium limneticum]|uniref:extracellular solute-binding protein n=1 Tax=Ferribacterium limneticum TaxID=76259 RepID=UPI001CFA05E2|nr:extracellular solute-binding protein [Ferribacterium limneticum]UCV29340.1 extracellular solute-binding protein [Ferribacterium limneticum]UCV33259.1 extracellular solute-binding protein [Ferribacterium limneticum]